MEQAFSLPSLNHTDARATSIVDSFDFMQSPRKFEPIKTTLNKEYFLHQPNDSEPPDDE